MHCTFLFTGMIEKLKDDPNFKFLASELIEAGCNVGSETDSSSAGLGTPIAISIFVTFVVTGLAVAFLTTVLVLVLRTFLNKRKQKELVNTYNFTPRDTELKAGF